MSYIDGFVIPVPADRKDAYRAPRIVERWGDDLPDGKVTDFNARSKPRKVRQSSSPGSSGPRRRCATRATRSSWKTRA
jgi:uncharacterized protein YbaA (DUF1428 family)